jgi:hypothetical protein
VGGAIGLWIGLSILSLCELVQLFVELCDYGIHKTIKEKRKGRRQRRKDRTNLAITSANSTSLKHEHNLPEKHCLNNDSENKLPDYDLSKSQRNLASMKYLYTGSDV